MRIAHTLTLAGAAAIASSCNQAPPASEPAPSGELVVFHGTVSDLSSFARLQNVGVELSMIGSATKPFATAVTDEGGGFAFTNLPAGKYMLHVARPGYTEIRMRVDASANADKPLDIRMRALSDRLCVPSRYHTPDCP